MEVAAVSLISVVSSGLCVNIPICGSQPCVPCSSTNHQVLQAQSTYIKHTQHDATERLRPQNGADTNHREEATRCLIHHDVSLLSGNLLLMVKWLQLDLQQQYTTFKNNLQQLAQRIGEVEQETEEHKCVASYSLRLSTNILILVTMPTTLNFLH